MKQSLQFLLLVFLATFGCSHPTQITGGGDDVVTGRLYYQNSEVAAYCQVFAVPSNSVQPFGPTLQIQTITDSIGRFSFASLPTDTYNIYGIKDSLASYLTGVEVRNIGKKIIIIDTLKPTGSIKGVVLLAPQGDSRRVLILVMGSYLLTSPDDSFGNFTLNNLAPGNYRIRFLALDSQYPVLDTTFSVVSGITRDIGTIVLSKSNIRQLEIANNEIPDWSVVKSADSFNVYTAANLHEVLDGGDLLYVQGGVVEIGIEDLEKAVNDTDYVYAYFMDFGTDINAAAMVQTEVSNFSGGDNPIVITGYDNNVALARGNLGGITVYAHFKKFYIELSFTGYQDQSQAISDAKLFLDLIKSKI